MANKAESFCCVVAAGTMNGTCKILIKNSAKGQLPERFEHIRNQYNKTGDLAHDRQDDLVYAKSVY